MTDTIARPKPVSRVAGRRPLLTRKEGGVGAALVLLVIVFSVLEPHQFATGSNILNVLADASTLVILAVATTFVTVSKNLDLSLGGVVALCEVVSVKSMTTDGGMLSSFWGLIVALAVGVACGGLNGLLISRLHVPSFVATLAVLGITQGGAYVISGGVDISTVPTALADTVGTGAFAGISSLVWIAGILFVISAWMLRSSRFGRHTYAVGSDELSASRAGVNVPMHTMKIYLLAGAMYGLVAWMNLSRFSSTNVGGHANDALNAITAVVLGGVSMFGGVGSAIGALIGVFIPAVIRNGLVIASVQPFWQLIAVGAALAVAVSLDSSRRNRTLRRE